MSPEPEVDTRETRLPAVVGWGACVALAGYAVFLHQGLGSPPGGWASQWWQPTSFLLLHPVVGGWADIPRWGTLFLVLPAAALALAVFLGVRSAVVRTIAVSLVAVCTIFPYAGFTAGTTWELFHWRLSVVMLTVGLCIGLAAMSPALSAAWLRRGWLGRLLLYVPIAFATVALIRNATGTDESLVANLSPWPGITVVGFEMGAYTIVGALLGLAIGLGALTQWGRRPGLVLVGVLSGVLFPVLWFYGRFSNSDAETLVRLAAVVAVALALAAIARGDRRRVLGRRAALFTLGACLVLVPIFTGRAWANADYTLNKFVRARIAQDALAAYYETEGVYPDRLDELIQQGYLEELPQPRVGFGFLYDLGVVEPIAFSYQGLGASYVLEFVSTEWVQCAYNPPWSPIAEPGYDADEPVDESGYGEEGTTGAWSCPETRPALWGGPESAPDDEWGEEEDWDEEEGWGDESEEE